MRISRIFENITSFDELPINDFDQKIFVSLISKHKALLLKHSASSPEYSVNEFGNIISKLNLKKYPYFGGAAPRRTIPVDAGTDLVYTANESPPHMLIPFHHELAQVKDPPSYLFFYCEKPSDTGGETALIDSTLVYRFVKENFPDFMEKLKTHGARYTRILPEKDDLESPLGRSFYNTYQVSSKKAVEEKLNSVDGLEYEWLNDGALKVVSEPIPAVRFIGQQGRSGGGRGEEHAIYQWTFHNSVIAAFIGWQDSRNDRKKAVRFGNNEKMDESILESIASFMEQKKVSYKWEKGDIFALNNNLVMHSRNSFTGTRRVYAAMFGHALLLPLENGNSDTSTCFYRSTIQDPTTFGFWRVEEAERVAYEAIKYGGYRRLDLACDYGNEKEAGKGIRRAISEGICKREELYITSKLWNTYHHPNHVSMALDRTLQDLGLDYVDEYLIHFPISMEFVPFDEKYPPEWHNCQGKMILVTNDMTKTWHAMEQLMQEGKVKQHIGLSNFNCQLIRQILATYKAIKPTVLQIECHVHLNQEKLIRFARCHGMQVSVFSPLGATSYISLNMADENDLLINDRVVKKLATKHGKSPFQILLRWAIQRNTLPISKTSKRDRMKENRALFDFYLTREDVDMLDSLNLNRRYNDPGVFCEAAFGSFCPIYE